MKLAIIFDNFGPYHYVRLNAVAKITETIGIELFGKSYDYAWIYKPKQVHFSHFTLFPELNSQNVTPKELRERINSILDKINPDVIAINGYSEKSALFTLKWCLKNGKKTILMSDSTEYDFNRTFFREYIKSKLLSLYSSALVGGYRHVKYLNKLGFNEKNIFNCYDVVDNDYFSSNVEMLRKDDVTLRKKYKLPKNFILVNARLIPKKNLLGIIKAYDIYQKKINDPYYLVIIGDGVLRDNLIKLINELNLSNKVMLTGYIQYEELPVYYATAKFLILASLSEQWGLVVNEAMASGLPVIVSERCGCSPELVKNNINGYTFNPKNIQELCEKMMLISKNERLQIEMGMNSRQIISKFTPETFALNLLKAANVVSRNKRKHIFIRLILEGLIRS